MSAWRKAGATAARSKFRLGSIVSPLWCLYLDQITISECSRSSSRGLAPIGFNITLTPSRRTNLKVGTKSESRSDDDDRAHHFSQCQSRHVHPNSHINALLRYFKDEVLIGKWPKLFDKLPRDSGLQFPPMR